MEPTVWEGKHDLPSFLEIKMDMTFLKLTGIVTDNFSSRNQTVQIQIIESVIKDTFRFWVIQN